MFSFPDFGFVIIVQWVRLDEEEFDLMIGMWTD